MSRRTRWLLCPAPALLLVLAYLWLLRPNYTAAMASTQRQIDAAKSAIAGLGAPSPAEAERQLLDAERTAATLRERERQQLQRWSQPERRTATVQELTQLLGQCGALVERSAAEANEADSGPLPPSARQLAQDLGARGGAAPALWRLDLRCTWPQLIAAVDALTALRTFALPVGVHVEPTERTDTFGVKLWIWI